MADHRARCRLGYCFADVPNCPIAGEFLVGDKVKLKFTNLGRYTITGVGRDHVFAVHVNPEHDEEVVFYKNAIEKVD